MARLLKTKNVQEYEIRTILRKNLYLTTLTSYQIDKIVESMDRFHMVEVVRNKPSSFLGRVSIPFQVLTFLLIGFIFSPIKYLFTGNFYFNKDSLVIRVLFKWSIYSGLSIF